MGGFKCFITPTSFFPIQEIISRIKISYGNNLAYAVIYLKRGKSLKKLDLTIPGYILLGRFSEVIMILDQELLNWGFISNPTMI